MHWYIRNCFGGWSSDISGIVLGLIHRSAQPWAVTTRCRNFVQNIWLRTTSNHSRGYSVCWRFGSRDLGFESCIQQREITCLLWIQKSLACARASKLTTTNMYIPRARSKIQPVVGSSGRAECSLIIGTGCWVQGFCLILDSSIGLWVGIQSASD